MKRQLRLFFSALSFYSRLPVPAALNQHHEVHLPDAIRYFPLIGYIAGTLAAGVYVLAQAIFGSSVAVLLSMASTVLLTGAFHEDGFADVCDGFGGGYTKEKILLIMKDSRLGTYGVLGLIILLLLKYTALAELFSLQLQSIPVLVLTLVMAHSMSRFAAITLTYRYTYARVEESKASAAAGRGRLINLLVAAFFALMPLLALIIYTKQWLVALVLLPVFALILYLGSYFKKWIAGYTGDCLGAVQQLTELAIYLSLIAIWRFI